MGLGRRRGGIGLSLCSSSRLSSLAKPKESSSERRRRRKDLLEKELDDESDITLSDNSSEEKVSGSRKNSLSPTQYLGSLATDILSESKPRQQGSMERSTALSTPA
jgi:hypothetical protein